MCGICGIYHLDEQTASVERIHEMTEALQHRGPDDEGYFVQGPVALGFRRLSIIDLAGGRQPMSNEDGWIHVVFNGEIYNFKSLREELEGEGHVFRTSSDTEVIVHGYEEWGDRVVDRLNGMFAFAVRDGKRQRLLLARDRLGIKPLYTCRVGSMFAFASEIKSLIRLPELDLRLSSEAVFDYFSHLYVPAPKTIYENISKVRPGEALVVDRDGVRVAAYWQPHVRIVEERLLPDWCEELRHRIEECVHRQMVADVPIGAWLSGGIDSSAVTAAMVRSGSPVHSFSVGFDVRAFDETRFAERVSRHLGTAHEAFTVSAVSTGILPRLLWHLDEPMADPTVIPTYFLSQRTRERVKVVLSGEGGDELFAGYTVYQGMQINALLRSIPPLLRKGMISLLGSLPAPRSPRVGYGIHRLERILASSLQPPFEDYLQKVAIFGPEEHQLLFSETFRREARQWQHLSALRRVASRSSESDPVGQAMLGDLTVYLPEDMLTKVDRMSMACSLEARVPLLDHTFVEFALTIPTRLKLKGLRTKHVLREALLPWLPADILNRAKQPFVPPLEYWLHDNFTTYAARHGVLDALEESGYINTRFVSDLMREHSNGRRNYSRQLWALFVFALWWRYVKGRREKPE